MYGLRVLLGVQKQRSLAKKVSTFLAQLDNDAAQAHLGV
jgi:hypothetical protein